MTEGHLKMENLPTMEIIFGMQVFFGCSWSITYFGHLCDYPLFVLQVSNFPYTYDYRTFDSTAPGLHSPPVLITAACCQVYPAPLLPFSVPSRKQLQLWHSLIVGLAMCSVPPLLCSASNFFPLPQIQFFCWLLCLHLTLYLWNTCSRNCCLVSLPKRLLSLGKLWADNSQEANTWSCSVIS